MFWHGGVGLSPTLLVSLVANGAGRMTQEACCAQYAQIFNMLPVTDRTVK